MPLARCAPRAAHTEGFRCPALSGGTPRTVPLENVEISERIGGLHIFYNSRSCSFFLRHSLRLFARSSNRVPPSTSINQHPCCTLIADLVDSLPLWQHNQLPSSLPASEGFFGTGVVFSLLAALESCVAAPLNDKKTHVRIWPWAKTPRSPGQWNHRNRGAW
jgi:hypothetical protein